MENRESAGETWGGAERSELTNRILDESQSAAVGLSPDLIRAMELRFATQRRIHHQYFPEVEELFDSEGGLIAREDIRKARST